MKTRKWPLLLMAILTVLSMSSCQDWGEADPPAGNQKLPAKPDTSAKLIAEFTFDEDFNSTATEGETPISGEGFAYSADQEIPEIVQDDERENGVMHANGGYLRILERMHERRYDAKVVQIRPFRQPKRRARRLFFERYGGFGFSLRHRRGV